MLLLLQTDAGSVGYVGSTNNSAATTACSVPTHADVEADDLLLVQVVEPTTTPTVTVPPAGYTLLRDLSDTQHTLIYYRVATGDASDDFSMTWSSGARWTAISGAYRGVDTSSPFIAEDGMNEPGSGTSHSAPAITNTDTHAVGVFLADWRGTATPISWTPPAGMTERQDVDGGVASTANHVSTLADTDGTVGTGAVTYTGTSSASSSSATMWAAFLRPASAGGGALSRSASDTAAASDTCSASVTLARAMADTAAAVDAAARTSARSRSQTDTAAATDGLARSLATPRSLADTAAATDALTRSTVRTRALSDTAAATDAVARSSSRARAVSDTAPATDSTSGQVAHGISRSTSDSAPATDTTSRTSARQRSTADNAPASDSVTRSSLRSRSLAELAQAADAAARALLQARSTSDSAPAVDAAAGGILAPRRDITAVVESVRLRAFGDVESVRTIVIELVRTSDPPTAARPRPLGAVDELRDRPLATVGEARMANAPDQPRTSTIDPVRTQRG